MRRYSPLRYVSLPARGVVSLAALLCASCGGSGLHPVEGKVLFNGQGAKGAVVTFTIYTGTSHLETVKTAIPKGNLVSAARQAAAG